MSKKKDSMGNSVVVLFLRLLHSGSPNIIRWAVATCWVIPLIFLHKYFCVYDSKS